jgi:hypothetical protein
MTREIPTRHYGLVPVVETLPDDVMYRCTVNGCGESTVPGCRKCSYNCEDKHYTYNVYMTESEEYPGGMVAVKEEYKCPR